jgi:N12 class adenine-specific DNA methylase
VATPAFDQGFDSAQGGRRGPQLHRLGDGGGPVCGVDGEGDDRAEAIHLRRGPIMTGIVRQARVAGLDDGRMSRESFGDRLRIGLSTVETDGQGAQSAQCQPHLEGAGDRSAHRSFGVHPLAQFAVAGQRRAEDDIGVSGQVLRDRVDDDVGAEVERRLQQRSGERVVDGHKDPPLLGGGDQRRDVGDLEHRVRRRFDPQQPGGGPGFASTGGRSVRTGTRRRGGRPLLRCRVESGRDGCGVGDVDGDEFESLSLGDLRGRGQRPLVAVGGDDERAAGGHRTDHRRDRRQPRAEDQARKLCVLELGQRLLEMTPGRRVEPSIGEGRGLDVAGADEGRGQIDKANPEVNLIDELRTVIEKIPGTFELTPSAEEISIVGQKTDNEVSVSEIPNFNYGQSRGKIYFNNNGYLEAFEGSEKAENQLSQLIKIKEELLQVIHIQRQEDYSEEEFQLALAKLNQTYDTFVSEFGPITQNAKVIQRDEYLPLLKSIEIVHKDGSVEKGDVFFKATIRRKEPVTSVNTAIEALQLSLGRRLKVDLDFMADVYGKDKGTIVEELEGQIFIDPLKYKGDQFGDVWEVREEYLSGDVKLKLVEARHFNEIYPGLFEKNVSSLENAQPEPLKAGEIDYSVGSTWIPKETYEQFMFETFETPPWMVREHYVQLDYDPMASRYFILGKNTHKGPIVSNRYGTARANAYLIFENSLNLQKIEIRDRVEDGDGKSHYVLNPKETQYARSKQEELQEIFKNWVMNNSQVLEELQGIYEERFNRLVPRTYDGSYLEFDDLNEKIELRPHQKNMVARIIQNGRGLMAHVVGAGKTLTMIASGMMMKAHGLIKKPMYVVPNHLTGDFGTELLRFYPSKKVLVTTKKDFEKANRQQFVSRIAVGDYDAVVIGHSQFEKIALSPGRQRSMLKAEINQVSEAIAAYQMENDVDSWSIKQMISFEKRLNERLEKLNKQDKKDDLIYFEDLGIDFLFVDEAHLYKNLYSYTKLSNVAGVNASNSLRSSDMEMKVKYVLEENHGRGVVFATGTPISNSMSEMYTMQKYLQPDVLKDFGVYHFDAWASTFGEIVSSLEITPEGSGYQMKNRFSKFHNLPELMSMFNLIADIQTKDMLNLPVPAIKGGKAQIIVTDPISYQKDKMDQLAMRAEKIRNREVSPEQDNMLKITNEAKLMALDPRLLDDYDESKYDPQELKQTKIARAAEKVFSIWLETKEQRSTQLIFSDSGTPKPGKFNVYDEIKRQLIEKNIPENEIAFIHDAKTEAQRDALFEKVREGEVRILVGSTGKVGTGTNIQDKLIAAHHVDCPWRPSDIEQRDGRIVRQGNENKEIQIYRYVAKGTFDSFLWQIQEQKLTYISQVMTGKAITRTVDEMSETVLDASEIKAVATGNPLLADKMRLDNEIAKLRMLQSSYLNERELLKRSINQTYPAMIKSAEQHVSILQEDIQRYEENNPKEFAITIDGKKYTERSKAGEIFESATLLYMRSPDFVEMGEYKGFKFSVRKSELAYGSLQLRIEGRGHYDLLVDPSTQIGSIRRIENKINQLPEMLQEAKDEVVETKEKMESAKEQIKQPFIHAQELQEKVLRQQEIQSEIESSLSKKTDTQAITDEKEKHLIEEREL